MHFRDARAECADPILRVAVQNDITDVEVRFEPRAFKVVHVSREFDWAEQELVPDLFNGDDDLQFLRKGQELANVLLRALPGIAIADLRVDDGGNEKDGSSAPEFRIMKAGLHTGNAFGHHGRIG